MYVTMAIAYSRDVMEKLENWLLPSDAGIHIIYMYMHMHMYMYMQVSCGLYMHAMIIYIIQRY